MRQHELAHYRGIFLTPCDECGRELHKSDLVLHVEVIVTVGRSGDVPNEIQLCSFLCMKQYAEDRELST